MLSLLSGAKRLHSKCDDYEDEVEVALIFAYTLKRRRLQEQMIRTFAHAAQSMLDAYVKYRGGLNAVLNFELPEDDALCFDFDSCCDKSFVQDFRFNKEQVNIIVEALVAYANIPPVVVSYAQDKAPLRIAFLMLCMKYAWPTRLGQMVKLFGKSISWMSRIITTLRKMLFNFCHPHMRTPPVLSSVDLGRFTNAVKNVSGLDVCFGFLDGTVRPICRPSVGQKECYNGKDRLHAIKFQVCSTPDGIIQHIDGPWPGRRHDHHMVNSAPVSTASPCLVSWILAHPPTAYGTNHIVYADQGYYSQPGIETPWPDGAFNAEHQAFNDMMKASRIAVEWEFGHILEHWASFHFKPSQKLLTAGIGQAYIVAAFLTNVFNIMHPSKTAIYFQCSPPDLATYLSRLK
jgi:hypothetical protein